MIGNRTAVKVVKNKLAPPFARVEFDLMYSQGISMEGDILDLGTKFDIVEKSGAWYSYQGERLGQGRENAKISLKENQKLCNEIKNKVLIAAGIMKTEQKNAPSEVQMKEALKNEAVKKARKN